MMENFNKSSRHDPSPTKFSKSPAHLQSQIKGSQRSQSSFILEHDGSGEDEMILMPTKWNTKGWKYMR